MPDRPLAPNRLRTYADPRYLSVIPPAAATPPPGPNWMHREGLPVLAAGQAADAATTIVGLRAGASETNPIYGRQPSTARIAGTKAATMVPLGLLLNYWYRIAPPGSRQRKIALALANGLGGVGAGAATHNLRVTR